jgi:hypothetical protein
MVGYCAEFIGGQMVNVPSVQAIMGYSNRAWCMVESFIFAAIKGLDKPPQADGENQFGCDGDRAEQKSTIPLYSFSSYGGHKMIQHVCPFDVNTMPSECDLTFETDRASIIALEKQVLRTHGLATIEETVSALTAPGKLDLVRKGLDDGHVSALAAMEHVNMKNIRELDLSSNTVGNKVGGALARLFARDDMFIEQLLLGQFRDVGDEGLAAIVDGVRVAPNHTLKVSVGCAGVCAQHILLAGYETKTCGQTTCCRFFCVGISCLYCENESPSQFFYFTLRQIILFPHAVATSATVP